MSRRDCITSGWTFQKQSLLMSWRTHWAGSLSDHNEQGRSRTRCGTKKHFRDLGVLQHDLLYPDPYPFLYLKWGPSGKINNVKTWKDWAAGPYFHLSLWRLHLKLNRRLNNLSSICAAEVSTKNNLLKPNSWSFMLSHPQTYFSSGFSISANTICPRSHPDMSFLHIIFVPISTSNPHQVSKTNFKSIYL